jgi:hypothetical protein
MESRFDWKISESFSTNFADCGHNRLGPVQSLRHRTRSAVHRSAAVSFWRLVNMSSTDDMFLASRGRFD